LKSFNVIKPPTLGASLGFRIKPLNLALSKTPEAMLALLLLTRASN
jgi:hypothetical protein